MATFFLLDDTMRARLQALAAHAQAHRIGWATAQAMREGRQPPVGDDPAYVLHDALGGYRIVYSIEEHPPGWFHHVSVSVATPGRFPLPSVVRMIAQELGISRPLHQCKGWIEEEAEAVNLLAPLEG
jgi:hypothetical protein